MTAASAWRPVPGGSPWSFLMNPDTGAWWPIISGSLRKKLGIRFKIVKYESWSRILAETRNRGNIDVIAAAHPTPERWTFMNWTDRVP